MITSLIRGRLARGWAEHPECTRRAFRKYALSMLGKRRTATRRGASVAFVCSLLVFVPIVATSVARAPRATGADSDAPIYKVPTPAGFDYRGPLPHLEWGELRESFLYADSNRSTFVVRSSMSNSTERACAQIPSWSRPREVTIALFGRPSTALFFSGGARLSTWLFSDASSRVLTPPTGLPRSPVSGLIDCATGESTIEVGRPSSPERLATAFRDPSDNGRLLLVAWEPATNPQRQGRRFTRGASVIDVIDEIDPRSPAGLLFGASETANVRGRRARVDRRPATAAGSSKPNAVQISLSWIEPRGTKLSVVGTGVSLSDLFAVANSISFDGQQALVFTDARQSLVFADPRSPK